MSLVNEKNRVALNEQKIQIDKQNDSALHIAVENGQLETVRMLLSLGIKTNNHNFMGYTPLHLAVAFGHIEIVDLLWNADATIIKTRVGQNILHLAAINGHLNILKTILVKAPLLINEPNHWGNTALHLAAKNGHTDIVKFLLDNHANSNYIDQNGNTAFDLACINQHENIISLLTKT